jgi:hypothetical protein
MADKPILFSALEIQALLDGSKTQTRRVLTQHFEIGANDTIASHVKVKYATGDRLWVVENYKLPAILNGTAPRLVSDMSPVSYPATAGIIEDLDDKTDKRIKSRWASRITLLVTDVRVERLQDINRGGAMEEGCPFANMAAGPDPRNWFSALWNSINGPDAWDANPWVAALTFTVHRCNIDKMEKQHG